jgi:hypothetical protein
MQEFTRWLTNYRKVHGKEKELAVLAAAWPGAGGWLTRCALHGPAPLGGSACPPADVDFIQLSKIRGAANGKVETSRGRKSIYGSATGSVAASGVFR